MAPWKIVGGVLLRILIGTLDAVGWGIVKDHDWHPGVCWVRYC